MLELLTLPAVICLVGMLIGSWTDYSTGLLPNRLTFPMMALGLAIWTTQGDPLFALKGLLLALAIHFPLFALNVVRAGDAKLVMAAGALLGWVSTVELTVWYAAIYLPVGIGMLVVKGRLKNLGKVAMKLATNPSKPDEEELEQLTHLRTGPVIAAAAFATVFTDWLNFV